MTLQPVILIKIYPWMVIMFSWARMVAGLKSWISILANGVHLFGRTSQTLLALGMHWRKSPFIGWLSLPRIPLLKLEDYMSFAQSGKTPPNTLKQKVYIMKEKPAHLSRWQLQSQVVARLCENVLSYPSCNALHRPLPRMGVVWMQH